MSKETMTYPVMRGNLDMVIWKFMEVLDSNFLVNEGLDVLKELSNNFDDNEEFDGFFKGIQEDIIQEWDVEDYDNS